MRRTGNGLSRRGVLLGAAAAAGCAVQPRVPPLAELYRDIDGALNQPPLIVIPGLFGSQLRRRSTGEEIWPRSNLSLLFSSYPDVELEIDPATLEPITEDVEAFAIFRKGMGRDFYGAVLKTLEKVGGYTGQEAGREADPRGERSYYVYTYDWRLDNVAIAQGLHDLIEQIARAHGDPELKVDMLAHSNGGLLARYYARFGTADMLTDNPLPPDWNGSGRIRRMLMVGTPNLGTMQPVLSHVRGEEMGLRHIPADVVATCSGAPQLMPHPDLDWLVDLRGDPIDLDLYDIETWRELKWSIYSAEARGRMIRRRGSRKADQAHLEVLEAYLARHLERGRRFQRCLSLPAGPDEPRPYIFGGDCMRTVGRIVWTRSGDSYRGFERADRIPDPVPGVDYQSLITDPGDGVVTRSSLMGRGPRRETSDIAPLENSHSVFLCEDHQLLTSNLSFQDNLLYTLLHHRED